MNTPYTTPPSMGTPHPATPPHGYSSPSTAPMGTPHTAPPPWAPLTQHHPHGHCSPSYTSHGHPSASTAPMGTPQTAPPRMGTPHPEMPPWAHPIHFHPHGHPSPSTAPHGHPLPSTAPWHPPWAPPTQHCPPKGTAHPRHWVPASASLLTPTILTPLTLGLCPNPSLPAHTGSLSAWGCSTLMLGSVCLVVAAEDTEAGQGKWPPALGPSRFFSLTAGRSCTPRLTVMAMWTVTPRCSASVKASARS
ncbi:unnamed protein product [Caretta caretta]